ncbi:hypothetical protein EAH89_25635 [Roseomonas nepalensis]|uniref:Toprim domain-containing protein n=1 Tax=Muricoccus nepalensis TaxID=1854500 RepID=A0A502F9D1_9PROT|nr:MobF family relaxase [Roseomonas nepalensis]TPG46008.1 hypothetical protein EAH89_25635 [Roseomonas nepalensis]
MLTFRQGTPGGVEQAKAYVRHLLEQTLTPDQMRVADYYARRSGTDDALNSGMGSIPRAIEGMPPDIAAILAVDTSRPLTREELGNLLGGLRADGTPLPGSQRDVRTYKHKDGGERFRTAWMDLTTSVPKKVSLAWFTAATDAERNAYLQAHRTATAEMLAYVEKEIAFATFGHGKDEGNGLEKGRLGFVQIDHFTARPTARVTRRDPTTGVVTDEIYTVPLTRGDPQVHTHSLLMNVMLTESGRVVSIDTTRFAKRVKEFGAVYQAVLERELRGLGVPTRMDPDTLTVDLPGIPDAVAKEFSKRTMNGQEAARSYARTLGLDWQALGGDQRVAILKAAIKEGREGKGDDLASVEDWLRQAEAMGWKPSSLMTMEPPAPSLSHEERQLAGAEAARPILAAMFETDAVLTGSQVRMAAAQGLMAAGALTHTDDVSVVAKMLVRDGVDQDGQRTRLLMPLGGDRLRPQNTMVTTALHRDQEQRLVALIRNAARPEMGGGLSRDRLDAMLEPARLGKLLGRPGPAALNEGQTAAYYKLGGEGRVAVAIGGAGVGKTTLLTPMVAAWTENKQEVWGVAQAWRQANALLDAGVKGQRVWALDPFLSRVTENPGLLNRRSVVVLDEFALIGTRQMLQLMELREKIGFKIVMVGDARQCQSIAAGNVMDVLEAALGADHIPQVLKAIRQKSEEEQKLVAMIRHGDVQGALDIKRDKGEAWLVHGEYEDVVKATAQRWAEKVEQYKDQPGFRVGVATDTNANALAISRAIREIRQSRGEVGRDAISLDGTDGRGGEWTLNLAPGDRVRLFERTRGQFETKNGRSIEAFVGDNGSVLTVLEVRQSELPGRSGIVVETPGNKAAFIPWGQLTDEDTGRIKLTYGDVRTINSDQGATRDHTIMSMPSGSRGVNLFMLHVGLSRQTVSADLIGSFGAEVEQVSAKRPLNAPELTAQELEAAVWKNLVANLKREPIKASVLKLMAGATATFNKAREAFQGGMIRRQARKHGGLAETTVRQQQEITRQERALEPVVEQLQITLHRQGDVIEAAGLTPPASPPPAPARPRQAPRPAARGPRMRVQVSQVEAQQQFADAMQQAGLLVEGLPIMDGVRHPSKVDGDKGARKSGAYKAFYDEGVPNGIIWNYKAGTRSTWKATGTYVPMSAEEARRLAERSAATQAANQFAQQQSEKAGAQKAADLYGRGRPATAQNAYLAAKGITEVPDGLREDARGNLLVPLRSLDGALLNLQTIKPDGTKLYLAGARKNGVFFMIGSSAGEGPIGIAEGLATAWDARRASGLPVAMALDTSNLKAVATAIRTASPERPIVFFADNDHHLPDRTPPLPNAGLTKANDAADAVGRATVIAPPLDQERHARDKGTDWNDFRVKYGADVTRATVTQRMGLSEPSRPAEIVGRAPSSAPAARTQKAAPSRTPPPNALPRTQGRQGPRMRR